MPVNVKCGLHIYPMNRATKISMSHPKNTQEVYYFCSMWFKMSKKLMRVFDLIDDIIVKIQPLNPANLINMEFGRHFHSE